MRRKRARPKAPIGVAQSYAAKIRTWLEAFQDHVLETVLSAWEKDHPRIKTDAGISTSTHVIRAMAGLRVALAERFDPGTQLSADIRVLAARVVKKNQIEFQRTAGVTTTDLGLGSSVGEFRDRNIDYIKSLAGTQLDEIDEILTKGDAGALRVETLRDQIQERFSVTKSKADLLARDQVLKLNGKITETRQKNAGITHYIWRTSDDERVRPSHEELDGTTQSWSSAPVVDEETGRTAHPGEDYQCRCTADPILDDLDQEEGSE